jgi:hypothetical protein
MKHSVTAGIHLSLLIGFSLDLQHLIPKDDLQECSPGIRTRSNRAKKPPSEVTRVTSYGARIAVS